MKKPYDVRLLKNLGDIEIKYSEPLKAKYYYSDQLEKENKKYKENWNELKKELKEKFEEFRYVEDECLRIMAQEDDSILFSMSCIEKGDSNE